MGGYFLLVALVNASPVRKWLGSVVEKSLSEKLHTEVGIGQVEIGLFNRIILRDVRVEDQSGRTLLDADLLSAKIALAPLVDGVISLRSVSLLDASVCLYKDKPQGPINFGFIIDAFKTGSDKDSTPLNLRVNSLILRRCQVSYDELYRPRKHDVLDTSHLSVQDINANLSLKKLTSENLVLRVRDLCFREQSGLDVRSLTFRLSADRYLCSVSRFDLVLPRSRVSNDRLTATYDAATLDRFVQTLKVSGTVRNAVVAMQDIASLIPAVRSMDYKLFLSSSFSLNPSEIVVHGFSLDEQYGRVGIQGKAVFKRQVGKIVSAHAEVANIHFRSDEILGLYSRLVKKEYPSFLNHLGELDLKGTVRYRRDGECRVDANVGMEVGGLQTSLRWQDHIYTLECQSENFSVARLLKDESMPDNLAFRLETTANMNAGAHPDITAGIKVDKVDYHGYSYNNLALDGSWIKQKLSVGFSSSDENLSADGRMEAFFDGHRFSAPQLAAVIRKLSPARLRLYDGWGDTDISASVSADFKTSALNEPDGNIEVKDFCMRGNSTSDDYQCEHLRVAFSPSRRGTRLKLSGDFAIADIDGKWSVSAFRQYLNTIQARVFPELYQGNQSVQASGNEEWRFFVQLRKDDFFNKVLRIPLSLSGPLTVEGLLSEKNKNVSVVASSSGLSYGTFSLRDLRFYLDGNNESYSCLAQGLKRVGSSDIRFVLDAAARDGVLRSDLGWKDGDYHRYFGQLSTLTRFERAGGRSRAVVEIVPTEIVMGDTVWTVSSGVFDWEDKIMRVKDFRLEHAGQSLSLTGTLSSNPEDYMMADLQGIDVSYILNLIDLQPVAFSGLASGKIFARKGTGGNLNISAGLSIPGFCFNGGLMGNAEIKGRWSTADKRLWLDADMREDGVGSTQVKGFVGIGEKALDLHVTSKNTNVYFLRRYISDIFGNIKGRTTGTCRIFGPFKALDFEGEEQPDLSADILATGVNYRMSDGVLRMSPGSFEFSGFRVTDKDGGGGILDGRLGHKHLKQINYDVSVKGERMLVYDQPASPNASFYATVYGTGTIHLRGRSGLVTADVNIQPDARTLFTYVVDSPDTFGDTQLLSFRKRDESRANPFSDSLRMSQGAFSSSESGLSDEINGKSETAEKALEVKDASSDIIMNFLVDMTPGATLKVVTNEKVGDHILMGGRGAIRATYYNKGNFQMFGTLGVERGVYKMSIQDVIRKDFQLQPGGRIVFSGNPYDADLGLSAVYSVPSASLSDLNIGTNLSDNSVRVNCILNFTGKAHAPQVSFGLDLPTVSDDIKQMVRQLIATEEDMNMQILYLLGVGRFYTYNYADTQSAIDGQSQSSLAMKSFLSNTLSNQLNNIISNAMGTSNWTFGTNLATGQTGWSDMEVAGLLSGRMFNNRLILNGNFGYRDRATSTTNFVGDFDISYLLTPSGSVSLKAYSETNDRYFSKSSLTTQGIGIKLKRDFSNLKDLFTPRKRRNKKGQ